MARHLPTTVWAFYRRAKGLGDARRHFWRQGYVRTLSHGTIEVSLHPAIGRTVWAGFDVDRQSAGGIGLRLTRDEARMLARRLTECLEATRRSAPIPEEGQ